jgi:putative tricarboxylic transport membrane protein
VAPAVIGLILGPLAETQFRRALSISQGDPSVFFTRPLSLGLLLAAAAAIILPYLPALIARLKRKPVEAGRVIFGEGNED